MAKNRYVYGNVTETNNLGANAELPNALTGAAQTMRNTGARILMQTAGQTVPNTAVDVEIQNPLSLSQAVSNYVHTGNVYKEATGSVANAYIVESMSTHTIYDQNNTSATISKPTQNAYTDGMTINVFITVTNTGSSTIRLRTASATATNPIVYSQSTLAPITIYKQNLLTNTYALVESGDLFGNVTLMYKTIVPGFAAGFIIMTPTVNMVKTYIGDASNLVTGTVNKARLPSIISSFTLEKQDASTQGGQINFESPDGLGFVLIDILKDVPSATYRQRFITNLNGGDQDAFSLLYNTSNGLLKSIDTALPRNFSQSGYITLTNGFLLQWGYITGYNPALSYNFPIAFPNSCFSFITANADAQGSRVDNAFGYPVSNSQFQVGAKSSTSNNTVSVFPIYWIATGN